MIRVDISKSLEFIGLPLITFEKDGESLTFLLDTEASMNLIKKNVLLAILFPDRFKLIG